VTSLVCRLYPFDGVMMNEALDTRDRIKIAARKLVAERGVEAVTVREIVAEAKAKNGGSLNYYFGSKEALISEIVADALRDVSVLWLEALGKLEKSGGPKSVRDIVEVLISPQHKLIDENPHPTASRFLASVLFTRRRMVRDLMQRLDYSVFARLLAYIQELRPDIPPAIMQQRLVFFAWYLVSVQSAYEAFVASRRRSRIWSEYDPRINMIDTGTGLIEALVSEAEVKPSRKRPAARVSEEATTPKPRGRPKAVKDETPSKPEVPAHSAQARRRPIASA
jgi:AcrR family transcriptional regulator